MPSFDFNRKIETIYFRPIQDHRTAVTSVYHWEIVEWLMSREAVFASISTHDFAVIRSVWIEISINAQKGVLTATLKVPGKIL